MDVVSGLPERFDKAKMVYYNANYISNDINVAIKVGVNFCIYWFNFPGAIIQYYDIEIVVKNPDPMQTTPSFIHINDIST